MPFQVSAQSLGAKLHLEEARMPILVGLTALCLVVLLAVIFGLLSFAHTTPIEVVEPSTSEQPASEGVNSSAASETILVHVAGAVLSPGVYELTQGSRVNDAINASGGFAENADSAALNLARVLSDGEQLLVPLVGEASAAGASVAQTGQAQGQSSGGKVNINTAGVSELDSLPGIGESTAQKIVDDRTQNGPFASVEDLKRVSGIGDKKYAALEDYICIG